MNQEKPVVVFATLIGLFSVRKLRRIFGFCFLGGSGFVFTFLSCFKLKRRDKGDVSREEI